MLSILKHDFYGLTMIKIDGAEYAIGNEEEAVKAAKEYISESVWTFNSDFLACHSCLSSKTIKMIQEKCSEDCNDELKDTIADFDHFCDDAIGTDGLGHFLSPYDGEETRFPDFLDHHVGSLDFSDIVDITESIGETNHKKILVFRIN